MIWTLVSIRWRQLRRQFRQAGVFYTALLLLTVTLLELAIWNILSQKTYTPYLAAGLVVSVMGIHLSRKDADFVWKQMAFPKSNFFLEYVIGSLPVSLLFLLQGGLYYFPAFLLCFWVIAQIRALPRKRSFWQQPTRLIPVRQFEWIAGIRQQRIVLILFLLLAWATVWIRFLPLLFLWLLTIAITGFYQYGESLQLLYAHHRHAPQLIGSKLRDHGAIAGIILGPVLLAHTILFPGLIWINLSVFVLLLALLFLAILLKYATYEPGANLKGNSLLLGICAILMVIPIAFLIPLLLVFRYYGRARRHLNTYFHDPD